jgi:hypothetical protein
MLPRRAGLALVLFASCALAASAATPAKKDKPDPSREAVVKVLRHEIVAPVDRRSELADALAKHPAASLLLWQSGYVREGATWRAVEQAGQSSADDNLDDVIGEYRERREATPQTAAGQIELADWCRKQQLLDQERAHLRAAMEVEPDVDHTATLERLGYVQFGNEWLSREQIEKWQALNQRTAAALKSVGPRLDKIAERLEGSARQYDAAVASLAQFKDPDLIPVLESMLCGKDEPSAAAAVAAFAKIQGCEATMALAKQAVFSRWPAVREQATKPLKTRTFEDFVPALIGILATPLKKKISSPRWCYYDCPSDGRGTVGQFAIVSSYILAQETDDQFRVAVINQVDYRLTDALQGNFVRFRGGFHLEPEQQSGRSPTVAGYVASSTASRLANDLARNTAVEAREKEKLIESVADAVNERTAELNRRTISVLAAVSGREPAPEPDAWWHWWADFTDTQQIGDKAVVKVAEEQISIGDPSSRIRRRSCFAAGTPVWTDSGQVAIETIRVGDRVLAQNIDTGELAYKPVLRTTVRPARQLVRLQIADETIDATSGHRFWVAGEGWTKARDLKPRALVHTVRGNASVTSAEPGPTEETYNLVVDGFHDYFVGRTGMLVQDSPLPQPTNTIVPGLTRQQLAAAAGR